MARIVWLMVLLVAGGLLAGPASAGEPDAEPAVEGPPRPPEGPPPPPADAANAPQANAVDAPAAAGPDDEEEAAAAPTKKKRRRRAQKREDEGIDGWFWAGVTAGVLSALVATAGVVVLAGAEVVQGRPAASRDLKDGAKLGGRVSLFLVVPSAVVGTLVGATLLSIGMAE